MRPAHLRHARVTDAARDSQYARSGEEAGFTAVGKNGHVPKGHGEKGRRR
jgi:hypothetical protein